MKRVLTIQDISCLGKCSLTIALPVISALGVETVILPTAVLSTHTMFKNFTCKDLSDQIEPIASHWKSEDVHFDAIYTGYLGTVEQIDQVKEIFRTFRSKETLIFVDPVMADNGKLYPAFDMNYAQKNATLCAEADIIVPNITEAAFMTGMEYREEYDAHYIKDMLLKLNDLGPQISVLTGVSLEKGKTGVMACTTLGNAMSPFDSWLMIRGIRTLAIRMERAEKNAGTIARHLRECPLVSKVIYPGFSDHPGYELMKKQARGFGAMITFEVDSPETVRTILDNAQLFYFAESLGGTETLITYPITQTHAEIPDEQKMKIGITDRLLRLSVGIEGVDDLITEIDRLFALAEK